MDTLKPSISSSKIGDSWKHSRSKKILDIVHEHKANPVLLAGTVLRLQAELEIMTQLLEETQTQLSESQENISYLKLDLLDYEN